MARRKVTAAPVLSDWAAVDQALRDIRECQHALTELAVDRDRRLDSIKNEYAKTALPLQNRIKRLESDVKDYVDCHRAEMAGKSRAIDKLGLTSEFKCTQSPLQCTYLPTGQRILFRGLDDTQKIKSIKLPFGYIGVLWFEEADQIKGGEDAVRNVQQSALRGGEFGLTFISFNPPAAARNWANKYALAQRPGKRVHHSSYLEAPPEWLGPKFLAQAEYIKETRPTKYRHEYLGEAVGNGTQVFDNIRLEELSNKRIRSFGDALNGVDWGWYPDPWAFNRCWYDAGRRTLYIFDELTRLKINNQETARLVLGRIERWETVTADSAEMKSCGDYRDAGIRCREAVKGPGSVRESMKWLQGLTAIVIDPKRCPDTAKEFTEYEYETGKDGEVLPGYVDADNHHIDAVRYATNRLWLRRGT